jgi:iron complex transport system ATP-binding protein
MSDSAVLSCRQLTWQAAGAQLLGGIDLDLAPGELVAIVGPNGAGKSSLLKALMGLLPNVSGGVTLHGETLAAVPLPVRAKRVAYMPQQSPVAWPLTVRHTVELGRLPHLGFRRRLNDDDKKAVDSALAMADILYLVERTIDTLSGGELARVMLARLFAGQAPIILADEPIAALDPYHQLHIMELLQAHCRRGGSALVVMHDLTLAARFCQRVIVMQCGRVVADGTPQDVLSDQLLADVYAVRVKRSEGEIIPVARVD